MQQAILLERERITQMQWELDELQRKRLEMEPRLYSEQVCTVQDFYFYGHLFNEVLSIC